MLATPRQLTFAQVLSKRLPGSNFAFQTQTSQIARGRNPGEPLHRLLRRAGDTTDNDERGKTATRWLRRPHSLRTNATRLTRLQASSRNGSSSTQRTTQKNAMYCLPPTDGTGCHYVRTGSPSPKPAKRKALTLLTIYLVIYSSAGFHTEKPPCLAEKPCCYGQRGEKTPPTPDTIAATTPNICHCQGGIPTHRASPSSTT